MEGDSAMVINDIMNKTKQASAVLSLIHTLPDDEITTEHVLPLLCKAVNLKLMISEESELDIRKLIILSIKRQDLHKSNLSDDMVMKEIKKYDCHQTSLVARKKILLIMYIEKELEITLDDEEAVETKTLEQLALILIKHLKKGG